jgi:hypothetical protein
MAIHIEISTEAEQRLRQLAAERGLSLDEYIRSVLEKAASPGVPRAKTPGEGQAAEGRRNLIGKFAHLGLSVSREDIEAARREMWSNFPRDLPKSPQT